MNIPEKNNPLGLNCARKNVRDEHAIFRCILIEINATLCGFFIFRSLKYGGKFTLIS